MSDSPTQSAAIGSAQARADHDARRMVHRRLSRVAVALSLLLVGTFLRGLFGPEPPIRVASETTFITEPLGDPCRGTGPLARTTAIDYGFDIRFIDR